ncbi:hypothetical protein KKA00_03520 [bacterium]|nr:hypothetical protein [bacterium]MBU1651262.1 hypothetical protein [bacterium]MBU1882598.1 hypothetical protein [bacterium]
MKTNKLLLTLSVLLMFTVVPVLSVYAQSGQQHVSQQQQMIHANQMMQRMEHLQQRSKQLVMNMEQNMQQLQQRMRNNYETVQHLNESLDAMIAQTRTAMDRYQDINSNEQLMSTKVMQENMKQLHNHFQDITNQFEETLRLVEQMNEKLIGGSKPSGDTTDK